MRGDLTGSGVCVHWGFVKTKHDRAATLFLGGLVAPQFYFFLHVSWIHLIAFLPLLVSELSLEW